jgi:hypothetical protein
MNIWKSGGGVIGIWFLTESGTDVAMLGILTRSVLLYRSSDGTKGEPVFLFFRHSASWACDEPQPATSCGEVCRC